MIAKPLACGFGPFCEHRRMSRRTKKLRAVNHAVLTFSRRLTIALAAGLRIPEGIIKVWRSFAVLLFTPFNLKLVKPRR